MEAPRRRSAERFAPVVGFPPSANSTERVDPPVCIVLFVRKITTLPVPTGYTQCGLRTNLVCGRRSRERCVENLLSSHGAFLESGPERLGVDHSRHRERASNRQTDAELTLERPSGQSQKWKFQ